MIKDPKIYQSYIGSYVEYRWEDCFTPLSEVYEQAWRDGREELDIELDTLKSNIKKAREEIKNLIWNFNNDSGRGVESFAEEAMKHLAEKD